MKKISYYELTNVPLDALKKQYKISGQELEQSLRTHTKDATRQQLERVYCEVFEKKKD